MKKLISLLAVISVVSACSLSAFADTAITVGGATGFNAADGSAQGTITEADGTYTATLNADSAAAAQNQKTILAVKGTDITVGSIQYIGQSAENAFTFGLKDDLTEDVNVLIGGSDISPILLGKIVASTAPSTFTVSGTVTGYLGTTLPTIKVYKDNEAVATATVTEGGAFTVDVPVLENGSYTLKAEKLSHFPYILSGINGEKTDIAGTMIGGAVNDDNIIEISDIVLIANNYGMTKSSDNYTIAYDLNEDGTVEISDIVLVANNYGSTNPNTAE